MPNGFPLSRARDPMRVADLVCRLCNQIPSHPRGGDCEHLFCDPCLAGWMRKASSCPVCSYPLTQGQVCAPGLAQHELFRNVEVSCEWRDRGCRQFINLGDYDQHTQACPFGPAVCPNPMCGAVTDRSKAAQHQKVCPFRTEPCELCGGVMPVADLASHVGVCPNGPEKCADCGQEFLRKHRAAHYSGPLPQCPEREADCPVDGCGYRGRGLDQHLMDPAAAAAHVRGLLLAVHGLRLDVADRTQRLGQCEKQVGVLQQENVLLLTTVGKLALQIQQLSDCNQYQSPVDGGGGGGGGPSFS